MDFSTFRPQTLDNYGCGNFPAITLISGAHNAKLMIVNSVAAALLDPDADKWARLLYDPEKRRIAIRLIPDPSFASGPVSKLKFYMTSDTKRCRIPCTRFIKEFEVPKFSGLFVEFVEEPGDMGEVARYLVSRPI